MVTTVRDEDFDEDVLVIATEVLKPLDEKVSDNLFTVNNIPTAQQQTDRLNRRTLDIPFLRTMLSKWWLAEDIIATLGTQSRLPFPQGKDLEDIVNVIAAGFYGKTANAVATDETRKEIMSLLRDNIDPRFMPVLTAFFRAKWSLVPQVLSGSPDLAVNHEDEDTIPTQAPAEVAGLKSALAWLKGKGVRWADVLHGNVMQRSDGQLVLIDFDEYEMN